MWKRIISCILVIALTLTVVPTTVFAKTSGNLYGDVNGDKKIDLRDVLELRKYIADYETSGFCIVNSDVNTDTKADLIDLLMLKKYLAEWEIHLGPELLTISFLDGSNVIDVLPAEKNYPLGEIPPSEKSSKDSAILLGYYTDKSFKTPFYSDDPVTGNMEVYAQYQEMGGKEELNLTSFAQMDQPKNISFDIKKISGDIPAVSATTLIVKDGSDNVSLEIVDANEDGIYTVSAVNGFNEGCSYELNLAEGWIFNGKEKTVRTASFSIAMDEVYNLDMSEDTVYIKDTDSISYNVDGKTYAVLTSDILSKNGGTFIFSNASSLYVDDILCIYVGVKPTERNPKNGSELLNPAVYVKVSQVSGTTVTFTVLNEDDQTKLYNVPDNYPIIVSSLPTFDTGTVNLSDLDRIMYVNMLGETDGTYEKALESIAVGDFVTLYVSNSSINSQADLYYGEITAYNSTTKQITYKRTTVEAIENSMDMYSELSVAGDDIISPEEQKKLQTVLLSQVQQSGFGEEAAEVLCDMVTKTDGFHKNMSVQEYLLTDNNGHSLSNEQIKLLNLGKSFELSDDIKLSVELITKGDQLHFGDGVQLAIGVEAKFEVEVEDGKIAIELSATFIEEVALSPRVKGSIVTKEILFIPIPIGISVNASIDVKNYTAFSFEADIYTVANEDESTFEKIKNITKDPKEALGLANLPKGLVEGLGTIGDVMDKIEEIQDKVDKATETADKLNGYKEDLDSLWEVMKKNGTTKEEWEAMCNAVEKTNIASDLLGIMDMTTDTELKTEFLDGMQALMDKYSEVLQKETDWVTLVEKQIFGTEVCYFGLCIGMEVKFVVRADMSIAIGSNLEYEVGKRYSFWFKIGLFKPSAGSSTMDLVDEHFSFQFYVMGKIGLKAGIRAKVYVGIGTGKFASVGLALELGPYIKIYGFFVYEYSKFRPANTQNWTSKERMAGAMYLDFGLYVILSFEANALGSLFEYSHDFVDAEIPLLTVGESRYYYDSTYKAEDDEKVVVRDEDGNASNGITMRLPENTYALSYVDLDTGIQGTQALDLSKYNITLSNRNFALDKNTGKINVSVPDNIRYMECDVNITYLHGKIAFSQYDMTSTIHLVWTNLSDAEMNEYYTASVRVGNDTDGYTTIWSKKVLKNAGFDLPDNDTVKKLIGWNDYKYSSSTGYGSQKTEGLTLIEDKVYDYKVNYKTYEITVNGIQNADGTIKSETLYAKFGESFDFSKLTDTGTNKSGTYTKFTGVTTNATIPVNGLNQIIDLSQPINGKFAEALSKGITANANYVDDSVTATFVFNGADISNATVKVKKGSVPNYDYISVVEASGTDVVGITPVIGAISGPTTYYVDCRVVLKKIVTISFNSNSGSSVASLTKKEGTILPVLAIPKKTGYTFDGWYTNSDLTTKFTSTVTPSDDITLYAKWKANTYTVSYNVNGGNDLSTSSKTVTFDSAYGTLPIPTRTGYSFTGWYTSSTGGTQITSSSYVTITEDQTLYAQWKALKTISSSVFNFGSAETYTYKTNTTREPTYSFSEQSGETYYESDFTFKYKIQGATDYISGLPIQGGTYDVLVTRPADNDYYKFEQLYSSVLTINYITYSANANWYRVEINEHAKTGSSHTLDVQINWSDGIQSNDNLDINKDWSSASFTNYGARPTKFIGQGQGTAGLDRTLVLNVKAYDLFGNSKELYSSDKYWAAKDPSFDENIDELPNINTSITGISVDSCSKVCVDITPYGVNGALSGVNYIVDNSAVTVSGTRLLIDGSQLSSSSNNIVVKAKDSSGNTVTVASFYVTRNTVD